MIERNRNLSLDEVRAEFAALYRAILDAVIAMSEQGLYSRFPGEPVSLRQSCVSPILAAAMILSICNLAVQRQPD